MMSFEDKRSYSWLFFCRCHSYVGRVPIYPQQLNLQTRCLWKAGIPLHEIGHALGLVHTQQRSDRDASVVVHNSRIWSSLRGQYTKDVTNNFGTPYDYTSVMHYTPSVSLIGFLNNSVSFKYTVACYSSFIQKLVVFLYILREIDRMNKF